MPTTSLRPLALRLLALATLAALAPPASAQFSNPGAYTSPDPAWTTAGHNVLFFGNSYTISSWNAAVNSPSYGGARGVPELVRQIAMAAGHDAPFVKNVFHLGRGYDHHVDPAQVSLQEIDEPLLGAETWDFTVLQGYSTRPTAHPYMGNFAKHKANGLRLFDEVRVGSTNHVTQSPDVIPVLYQTWAREPGHWFFDPSSSWTAGTNIGIGVGSWTRGPVFPGGAEQMARQVRNGYAATRAYIDAAVPGTVTRIAPAGDVWQAAGWPAILYAGDHYHADSWGDLASALALYGTIWEDGDTSSIIASGALDPVLAAIGVAPGQAAQIAELADRVLAAPPPADPLPKAPPAILVDFSAAAGSPPGAEVLPHPGRHYNLIADRVAGAVFDAVDTRNLPTGVDIVITDGFAGETASGATGAWNGAVDIGGSLYDESAQRDSFFVGQGSGYDDKTARLEVRGLTPNTLYAFRFHGSRNSQSNQRIGFFSIHSATEVLDAAYNMNMEAVISPVRPAPNGEVVIDIDNGGASANFAYLGVLEISRIGPNISSLPVPDLGATTPTRRP